MQTQDEILKLAQTYGIPLPQTSKKLDWKAKARLYWIGFEEIGYNLCYKKHKNFYDIETHKQVHSDHYDIDIFAAPQMHEIAPFLPVVFDYQKIGQENRFSSDYWKSTLKTFFDTFTVKRDYVNAPLMLGYCHSLVENDETIWVEIKNNHYAEAYANLFLKLKELN